MHYIFNAITFIIISCLILNNYECLPRCFGGSLVFIFLYGYLFYISLSRKHYQRETSILMIACLILLGYNKAAYLESNKAFEVSHTFVIIYVLTFLLTLWSSVMARLEFRYPRMNGRQCILRQTETIDSIILRYNYILITFVPVLVTGLNFQSSRLYADYLYNRLPLSFFAILILIIAIFIQMRIMAGIPAKNYSYALAGLEKKRLPFVKKYFIYGFIAFFLAGSALELIRGFWLLWLGTAALSLVLAASLWNIWKYVLEDNSDAVSGHELPIPLNDGVFVVKVLGILFGGLIIYGEILMVLV